MDDNRVYRTVATNHDWFLSSLSNDDGYAELTIAG